MKILNGNLTEWFLHKKININFEKKKKNFTGLIGMRKKIIRIFIVFCDIKNKLVNFSSFSQL